MHGKTVLITGATSGIGAVAAESLARDGARIVLVARDRERCERTLERLRGAGPRVQHRALVADLSSMSEVRRVADEVLASEPKLDVLVNNAGALFGRRIETNEGLEKTFALNHLAVFALTLRLLDRVRASGPARIIVTASAAHRVASLDFDDLQSARLYRERKLGQLLRYGGPAFHVYARSKLCNILFTRALARRLAGAGVTANCLHPGFVATRFADEAGGAIGPLTRIAKLFAIPVGEGAQGLEYLAASPAVENLTGRYFAGTVERSPSAAARDDATAERLWEASEALLRSLGWPERFGS